MRMFRVSNVLIIGLLCLASLAAAAEKEPLNRFPRMVQEYFVHQVQSAQEKRVAVLEQISDQAGAQAYVESVRAKIKESFGPLPEKTPLNAQITGVLDRDTYTVEKILFESRPGFFVTGNLYIPKGASKPLPGVVGSCGHSTNGKAAEAYQSFAQGLARLGYVVLIFDPVSQGERLQYPDAELKSRIGVGVREHLYAGNQQFLVDEFIGTWRAWDGIRALDYLLSRKEVDPNHVGITGNSGGGTMTTWLTGLESRWTMSAPSCFVTTFLHNMENELPADTEQCPPKALALGLDHEDFMAALAPKPVILMGQEKDFFDVRGTEEAFQRLQRLYGLLGKKDRVAFFAGPNEHGYSQENREAMYRWFNQATRITDTHSEPAIALEKDEDLWCTPQGQVCTFEKNRTVFSYTRERAEQLKSARPTLRGEALKAAVKEVLRLPAVQVNPHYRILRPHRDTAYPKASAAVYAIETEPNILTVVYYLSDTPRYSRPPKDKKRAILYVSHRSSDAELRDEPMIREILAQEPYAELFACDVRGIGESKPNTCGQSFDNPYGPDYFYAIHSIMLDYPYPGQKTYDVLTTIAWLQSQGYKEVHLVAKGWGTIPATFAAVLSDTVTQVTLKNALSSYQAIAESETYNWPLSTLVPGILKTFDLPDCYMELLKKEFKSVQPWDALAQ